MLTVLSGSCSGENLYEFEELSKKEDYIIEFVAASEKIEDPMNFSVVFYETDGYGDLLKSAKSFSGATPFQVINDAVKEHKIVGIKVIPGQNVGAFQVRIYSLESGNEVFVRLFEEADEEVAVYYDFETGEENVL